MSACMRCELPNRPRLCDECIEEMELICGNELELLLNMAAFGEEDAIDKATKRMAEEWSGYEIHRRAAQTLCVLGCMTRALAEKNEYPQVSLLLKAVIGHEEAIIRLLQVHLDTSLKLDAMRN